jgi:hypothetical protein
VNKRQELVEMAKHRRRPRNVPHPDPDGVDRKVRRRPEASLHGSVSRMDGTNGLWPARTVDPKPPAICALYEDLAEDMPEAIFGQYPKALIGKLVPWLRCARHEILHVCSGSLPPGEGIRVDVREEAKPDILADGRDLPLEDDSVAAVLIDPPYTPQYARDLYDVEYPRPSHLLREAARVVRPAGRIGFVHYLVPMPPPGCSLIKVLGLSTGFGFPMRAVTIFEKPQRGLFEEEAT